MNGIKPEYLQQATLKEMVDEFRRRGANVCHLEEYQNVTLLNGSETWWGPLDIIIMKEDMQAVKE